jgi:hypothetical protein
MQYKTFAACTSALALAVVVACSKNTDTPVSPSAAQPGVSDAGPSGETLKATAPTPQSPVNNAQTESLVFTAGKSTAVFDSSAQGAFSYEFQVRRGGSTVCSATVGGGSGANVSWAPTTCSLDFDAPYTWRVRAVLQGAWGPWSSDATFRTPAGSYLRGTEVLDLLTDGRTVGLAAGGVQFTREGAFFPHGGAYIAYPLGDTLQEGTFSFIAQGVDEGNPGDKSKVMSMGEGHVDVTDNDYRQTIEVRGSNYTIPGTVTYRIITGDAGAHHRIHDTNRHLHMKQWSRAQIYFFKMFWGLGYGGYEIRLNGPDGPIHDADRIPTGSHPYRPVPHWAFIGAPPSRGGALNQTHPGMTVRSVWISGRPRPSLPTLFSRP